MKKHNKNILLILFIVLLISVFLEVRSYLNSNESVQITKNTVTKNTTDGKECVNKSRLQNQYYGINTSYDILDDYVIFNVTTKTGTFKIDKWYFSTESQNTENPFLEEPTSIGNLSKDTPLKLKIKKSRGSTTEVFVHFILVESDEKCLAYDEASTDSNGEKVGTYHFEVKLTLPNFNSSFTSVVNNNYNGVCKVIREGTDFNKYASLFNSVTADDIAKYNATTSGDAMAHYNTLLPFCFDSGNVSFNYSDEDLAKMIEIAISSWKTINSSSSSSNPNQSFMEAFNEAKEKAIAANHSYNIPDGASRSDIKSILSRDNKLTCAWDKKAERDENGKIKDYYVNKDYYYAVQEEKQVLDYKFYYTPVADTGKTKEGAGGSCTRTCEESVVVEYGPPEAQKAGLCFSYKIRVTSRVVCTSDVKGLIAPSKPPLCTPTPICNQIVGHENQGGPNEEFDACVEKCDGGKYSQGCSQKCYDEVYGSTDNKSKLSLNYENSIVQKTATSFPGYAGKYVVNGGVIRWIPSGGNTYGRWYQENEDARTRYDHARGAYHAASDGFKRAVYGGGNDCADPCFWTGCVGDYFLNQPEASKTYQHNLEVYNNALKACKASASCTSKTAEFEISVDYEHDVDGKNVKETVKFPYASSKVDKAKIKTPGNGSPNSFKGGNEIFIEDTVNKNGYEGCYTSGDARDWYQAAWSFPGTWVNTKTGEIKFSLPSNSGDWKYRDKKFCVPLDAKSVNTVWWEWSEINKNCYSGNIEDTIDYNIHGATNNFGYFGWDFQFKCFYGLRNEVCELDKNQCCKSCTDETCPDSGTDDDGGKTTISPKDYVFRIVDNNDLFPEGESSNNKNDNTSIDVGRKPGYNWNLEPSTISSLAVKNNEYRINPIELINNIQKRGNTIYSGNQYRDYLIILDKETLAEIRAFNRGKKYTDYGGNMVYKNGVTSYYSDLLSKLNSKVTSSRTIGVNNESEGE